MGGGLKIHTPYLIILFVHFAFLIFRCNFLLLCRLFRSPNIDQHLSGAFLAANKLHRLIHIVQTELTARVRHDYLFGAQSQCVVDRLSIEILVEVTVLVEINLFDFGNESVRIMAFGGCGSFEVGFGGGEGVSVVFGINGEVMAVFGINTVQMGRIGLIKCVLKIKIF